MREHRPRVECSLEARDRLLVALCNDFNPTVVEVAHETSDTLSTSYVFREESEANTLNTTLHEKPPSNDHGNRLTGVLIIAE